MATWFPRALYGSQDDVERNIIDAARSWADDVRAGRPLRALEAIELAPRTEISCDPVSDFAPWAAKWRLYQLASLRVEVADALDNQNREQIRTQIEDALLASAAGTLWLNVGRPAPNTIPIVAARVEALTTRWDELEAFRYVDRELEPKHLEQIIADRYASLLQLWSDDATGTLSDRLRASLERAAAATPGEARRRLAQLLAQLATREGRLRDATRFQDESWVIAQLATLPSKVLENAITGHDVKRLLFALEHAERRR